jgi:biotin carboxyl carrier protein
MAREQVTEIVAEMVANVLVLSVEIGTVVDPGDSVMLLESMKMEIPVISEFGGVVIDIRVSNGDVVQEGDILVVLA